MEFEEQPNKTTIQMCQDIDKHNTPTYTLTMTDTHRTLHFDLYFLLAFLLYVY